MHFGAEKGSKMEPKLIEKLIKNQLIFLLKKSVAFLENWVPQGSKGSSKKRVPLRLFSTQTYGTILGPILTSVGNFVAFWS